MRTFKPVMLGGIAALLASVLGLSSPAAAALTTNSLTANSLTANSLTANSLTANSLTANALTRNAVNRLAMDGTAAAEAVVPPLRGLTLPSGASFALPN